MASARFYSIPSRSLRRTAATLKLSICGWSFPNVWLHTSRVLHVAYVNAGFRDQCFNDSGTSSKKALGFLQPPAHVFNNIPLPP